MSGFTGYGNENRRQNEQKQCIAVWQERWQTEYKLESEGNLLKI
ncbi:hypothetical protein BRYFOR_05694 [Marvinbryantia formatexigens DSM 14469]|uniref:Uncharacterized protein n=1 Tax=Marvinbryantia formatexigens DSM 14469 TaxID=478749 RepID=C6LAQ0_9FIRM|nr:hypothetical protein BRYFOR_05694 [Marvinbryantia formatexigens DSM 14469]